jgi:hypothetical protein
MTLKDFFNEARTCHYDFPTVAAGLTTGVFSLIFKSFNSLYRKAGQRSVDKFRVRENGVGYYDIKGVKVSDISWHNFKDILCVFCYHDDDYRNREVLAEIIMKANPRYTIVQGPKKLYAQIKD